MTASEVIPNLYVGSYSDAMVLALEASSLTSTGIRPTIPEGWQYLAVTEYSNECPLEPWGAVISPFMGFPPVSDMARVDILDNNANLISRWLSEGKKVLVHCAHGHERSPLQVAWYIHQYYAKDMNEAYDLVIAKHPTAVRRLYWLPFSERPYPYNGEVFR